MRHTITDILLLLKKIDLHSVSGQAPRKYVTKSFNDLPIRKAGISDYNSLEQLCIELGLVSTRIDMINVTSLGTMISKHSAEDDELPEKFVRNVILGPGPGKRIRAALLAFEPNMHGKHSYPKKYICDVFGFPAIMPVLYEIGLLEKDGLDVVINPEYAELVLQKMTQENLERHLLHKKKIGEIGEKIALEFEKTRLASMDCPEEASKVKLVSGEFANAGYDMESFDKDEYGRIHKIYVEVKSSTEHKINFYLTANELKKAEMHAENYWIYFVPAIDEQTKKSPEELIRMQDPYKTVFRNPSFDIEPTQYRISSASQYAHK